MSTNLVVIGDALLDRELTGHVERVCNDSPAPVFDEDDGRDRPGGAALAAALAARQGCGGDVRLIAAIGTDPAGTRLRELLTEAGVALLELPYEGHTPEKIRLHAGRQVVLRLDRNSAASPIGPPGPDTLAALTEADAVLVSDYGRGISAVNEVRRDLVAAAASRPVVWDPHPRGPAPVPGVHLVTPNERELPGEPEHGGNRWEQLSRHAAAARHAWRAMAVAVTLGPEGALMVSGGGVPLMVPSPSRSDGDPCGAGDRFAGAAAEALAGGALLSEAVQAAVEAASRFVVDGAATTVVPRLEPTITSYGMGQATSYGLGQATSYGMGATSYGLDQARQLAQAAHESGRTVVATGGCFDLLHPGHVATLQAARELGDCLIVCINSDASVRRLKGDQRPLVGEQDRARVVGALSSVDAVVVFDEPTPIPVLAQLRPDVWVKGGDYFFDGSTEPALPEAEHVAAWGGQTIVVPYVAGHSTTNLVAALRGHDQAANR